MMARWCKRFLQKDPILVWTSHYSVHTSCNREDTQLLAVIVHITLDCLFPVQEPQVKLWGEGHGCWNLGIIIPSNQAEILYLYPFTGKLFVSKSFTNFQWDLQRVKTYRSLTNSMGGTTPPTLPSSVRDAFLRAWGCLHTATCCFDLLDLGSLCSQQHQWSAPLCLILLILSLIQSPEESKTPKTSFGFSGFWSLPDT